MTNRDEVTAAAERVRRANAGEALSEIYGRDFGDETLEYLLADDKDILARAYLATVAADEQREAAPYWLVHAMATRLASMQCDNYYDAMTCSNHELCVTEWCAICAAKAWCEDARKRCEADSLGIALKPSGQEPKSRSILRREAAQRGEEPPDFSEPSGQETPNA